MPKRSYDSPTAARFGAILRRLREARAWSLGVAARRCDLHPTYLGVLEKGGNMPSLETLFEIADVYGVSAAEIVREVEEVRRAEAAAYAKLIAERPKSG